MSLSPAVLDTIQNQFITKLNSALGLIGDTASQLLFYFIVFEVVFFGLSWAIKQDEALGSALIKVLKIGFIAAILYFYLPFLNYIMEFFLSIGKHAVNDKDVFKVFTKPMYIFKYGYDANISLLKVAMNYGAYNTAASTMYFILGFGGLLFLALIAVQVIYVNVGFYFVAAISLLFIPLSVFKPLGDMLTRALQQLFVAAVRILVLMLVLGTAIAVWSNIGSQSFTADSDFTQPLGFFISIFVVMVLSWRLPELAAQSIGKVSAKLFDSNTVQVNVPAAQVNAAPAPTVNTPAAAPAATPIAAATNVQGERGVASPSNVAAATNVSTQAGASNVSVSTQTQVSGMSAGQFAKAMKSSLSEANTNLSTRMSQDAVKQMKKSLQDVIAKNNNRHGHK